MKEKQKEEKQLYIIKDIDPKYVLIAEQNNLSQKINVPKYRLPLGISVGRQLSMDEFGMYHLYDVESTDIQRKKEA